jgi:predicted nucleic acid-binding protein
MSAVLLDTGPVVASLDRRDPHHGWVMQRFALVTGRVLTTGAVITEAAFFAQDIPDGIQRLIQLIDTVRIEIWDCFQLEQLNAAARLMARYADTPMDFADATLVLAAENFGVANIATLDQRGFSIFRFGRNRPFRLVLQDL